MVSHRQALIIARVLAFVLLLAVVTRWAWVSDDALITLRTALNVTHGWGWGYNAIESVQAYTHPLWFLTLVATGFLTNQWAFGLIAMGIAFTAIALGTILIRTSTISGVVRFTAALFLSNAFIEYSTSGLENSLSYALVAALLICGMDVITRSKPSTWNAILLGLLAAAALLNRLDLLLIIVLPLASVLWIHRRNIRFVGVSAGAVVVPLVLWHAWAWTTYGSLLPNTFLAKTNVDIPRSELILQGIRYVIVSLENDPATGLVIALGVVWGAVLGTWYVRAWVMGLVLYLTYWVSIGADFMAGRALSVPVFTAAAILALVPTAFRFTAEARAHRDDRGVLVGSSVAALAALVLMAPYSDALQRELPSEERWRAEETGVADEWGVYAKSGKTLNSVLRTVGAMENQDGRTDASLPTNYAELRSLVDRIANWEIDLLHIERLSRDWPDAPVNGEVDLLHVGNDGWLLGASGIVAGPRVHWIDVDALADAFLAQQSYRAEGFRWRMGHFPRQVPEGYAEAIRSGDPTRLQDAQLVGPLWELWSTIRK